MSGFCLAGAWTWLRDNLKQCFPAMARRLRQRHDRDPGEFWHQCLYACFWICVALFPIGYGWREALPPMCLVCLLLYYRWKWRQSVLRNLGPAWLFVCAAAMTAIGIACSASPLASLIHAGANINKAFILPFIAMECVRDEKELRGIVWAYVLACFWQGLDGVWQALYGHDFIMGYAPNNGRLTGSLGDYSVGNYIALALVPAFGVWFILRRNLGIACAMLVFCALFWPALFLLQGASSRSGALAVAAAVALWMAIRHGWRHWRKILLAGAVSLGAFMICQPGRLSPARVLDDNRWDLWRLGWRVFLEHPCFGAGAGQYNEAFRNLGLAPEKEVITISHPHNLYLDMLYAHGLVGFTLGAIFVAGFLVWGYRPIARALKTSPGRIYWQMAAWFWLGYAAWLVNGIFGHDFYRTWWLGIAMCNLGIMIGCVENGKRHDMRSVRTTGGT